MNKPNPKTSDSVMTGKQFSNPLFSLASQPPQPKPEPRKEDTATQAAEARDTNLTIPVTSFVREACNNYEQVECERDQYKAQAEALAKALSFVRAAISQPVTYPRKRTINEESSAFLILKNDCNEARKTIDSALAQWKEASK